MRAEFTQLATRALQGAPRWLDAGRIRAYAFSMLVVNLLFLSMRLWYAFIHRVPGVIPPGWDFAVFWSASWLALHGPAANVFDTALIESIARPLQHMLPGPFVTPWTYPPTFLLVVLPAALWPFTISYLAFVSVTIAFALHTCARILRPLQHPTWWLPIVAFPACWVAASAGQNSFLTFALIGSGLICIDRRPWIAGLLFGILVIKPQLGVVIPVALLFGRDWRAFVSAALTAVVFCTVAGTVLGFDTFVRFVQALPAFNHFVVRYSANWPNGISTIFGAARHFGLAVRTALLLHAAVAVLALGAVAWLWAARARFELRASVLVLATVLVPTYLLPYDLLLLGLPILWLVNDGARHGWMRGDGAVMVIAWLSPALFYMPPNWLAGAYAPFAVLALLLVVIRRHLAQRTARANAGAGVVRDAEHCGSCRA